jgi:hypothetical protein
VIATGERAIDEPRALAFETHQFKQRARPPQLQLARPSACLSRGLGHSLAAAKFLELAPRATFVMLLVDLAARRDRSGADAAGPITGVRPSGAIDRRIEPQG